MPESCSIPGCTSRRSKDKASRISFYHLPIDSSIRYQWLVSIKRVLKSVNILESVVFILLVEKKL